MCDEITEAWPLASCRTLLAYGTDTHPGLPQALQVDDGPNFITHPGLLDG